MIPKVDCFFFSSRRRHTRWNCDWSSDVCSSDLFRPGLRLDGSSTALDLRRVTEIAPRLNAEVGPELVHPRHARWDVEVDHLLLGQPVEVLDQRPQAVADRKSVV